MRMLDLFCGTKSMSNVFKYWGHEVFTIDNDPKHNPDLLIDILNFEPSMLPWVPEIVHASPPCTCFSVASIGTHWTGGKKAYIPKTDSARNALRLVVKTFNIIMEINPWFWFIENPRGVMRKLAIMQYLSKYYCHHEISYCKYGDIRMKPTDFWTNNTFWHPKPMCQNKRDGIFVDCHHQKAKRGSKTGTQGLNCAVERSIIPRELCEEIKNSCEI